MINNTRVNGNIVIEFVQLNNKDNKKNILNLLNIIH